MIGLPVGYETKEKLEFNLISNSNVVSNWTENTVFTPSAGTIVVDLEKEKLAKGFFYTLNLVAESRVLVSEEPFKLERSLTFTEIAYELTEQDQPNNFLLSFPVH